VNLIQNAYEAMGDAGGELRVETGEAERDGRKGIEVRIADTGPGIPVALREEIFNPFVTTKKTGTGLGSQSFPRLWTRTTARFASKNAQAAAQAYNLLAVEHVAVPECGAKIAL